MLRKILKSSSGIAGLFFLIFGFLLGLSYDPKLYKHKDTTFITDSKEYVKITKENLEKTQEKSQEIIFIWGSIFFGLLMIGNATWKSSKKEKDTTFT